MESQDGSLTSLRRPISEVVQVQAQVRLRMCKLEEVQYLQWECIYRWEELYLEDRDTFGGSAWSL